ncbi:MAG: hypothetical protein K8J09_04495 [Planctomycetes bacterium]|nr:hypothetical protein [Planctomycetota bacterium]MCC7396321.1 hypothetical protein [Planctomycetota bacterium]
MKRALVLAALALPACVSGSLTRQSRGEPVDQAGLEALRPGQDDLAVCLQRLGAPERVVEYGRTADGDAGMVLVWLHGDTARFGLQVSTPSIENDLSASFAYDDAEQAQPACALWFTPELVLERWRCGQLGELLPRRRRPASP